MKTLYRPDRDRIHRSDAWKTSAYAFVPFETHFGELCGFADDVVAPGKGFGMHAHRNMEISTLMLSGAQQHRDTTGVSHVLKMNAVQTMSAGTGIEHSEANASATEPFHSFQVWVSPRQPNGAPRHEAFSYQAPEKHNRLLLALSPDRREGSALIGQDAFFSVGAFEPGQRARYHMRGQGHGAYLHCAGGEVAVEGQRLKAGDALGVWETEGFDFEVLSSAELVLVEVPMMRGVRV